MTETSDQSATVASLPTALTQLRLENESSKQPAAVPKPCYFLDRIPREIRDAIYGYLLVNETLSTFDAWNPENLPSDQGRRLLLSLPFEYIPGHLYTRWRNFSSPVLRNIVTSDGTVPNSFQSAYSRDGLPLKRVRNWRFVIPTASELRGDEGPGEGLVRLCRLLSLHPPKSLEVQLIPHGIFHSNFRMFDRGTPVDAAMLLKPLELLRNIPKFELGVLQKADIPDTARSSDPANPIDITPFRDDLTRLVQGNSNITRVFEIYEKLLAYAQSFERHHPFSVAMDSEWGDARKHHGSRTLQLQEFWFRKQKKFSPLKAHPFRRYLRHPVEMNLEIASLASEDDDLESIRSARNAVIEYLEPQYNRIKGASSDLNEFIRHGKQYSEAHQLWCDSRFIVQSYGDTICLSLIEEYHQSFVRDAPTNIKRVLRRWQRELELIYSTGKREIAIKKLSNWLEVVDTMRYPDRTDWIVWAKEAVDDMDEQYFQIQAARKALFEADPDSDYGCGKFDVGNPRSDETVDWFGSKPAQSPESPGIWA